MLARSGSIEATIMGGGMITNDLLLSSLYHLQRTGVVREDIKGFRAPGSMTSTRPGSPLVAAAIATLGFIQKEHLAEGAACVGEILIPDLHRVRQKYPKALECLEGEGLVAAIQVVNPVTKTSDPDLALQIDLACLQKGLLMFAPVGINGEFIEIAPPLTVSEEALREPIPILEEFVDEVVAGT